MGIRAERWPRFQGVPLQHVMTVDLEGLEGLVPRASEYRAVSVFALSCYENDADIPGSEEIQVVWLTEADVATGRHEAPPDFVPEPAQERVGFEIEEEDDDDPEDAGISIFIGGAPVWDEELGAPDQLPGGAFVMQLDSGVPMAAVQTRCSTFSRTER